jgi:tetratricopeptide (TPR) repeat protein
MNSQRWRSWVASVKDSGAKFLRDPEGTKRLFVLLFAVGVLYAGWSSVYEYWVLGNDEKKGEHAYQQAETLVKNQDWDPALRTLFEAELFYRQAGNVYGAVDVEVMKALVYGKKGDAIMSAYIMQRANDAVKARKDPLLLSYFYEHLLSVAVQYGQFSSIPGLANQNVDLLLSQGKKKRAATSLVVLGDQVRKAGGPAQMVIELYTRALFLYEQQGDFYNQAQCHERIADILSTADAKAALSVYQRAQALFLRAQKPERSESVEKKMKNLGGSD